MLVSTVLARRDMLRGLSLCRVHMPGAPMVFELGFGASRFPARPAHTLRGSLMAPRPYAIHEQAMLPRITCSAFLDVQAPFGGVHGRCGDG